MAHMVDKMIWTGQPPWHGLGIQLPEKCNGDTLRELVFDWNAVEVPIFTPNFERQSFEPIPSHRAICRSDNGLVLSVMPETYKVVQYADALALLDSASAQGEAHYVTAGTLKEGKRAWALATIPSCTFDVAGSELKPYLLLSTAHDGSRAVRCLFTSIYVVCNNTETAALAQAGVLGKNKRASNVLTIMHVGNVEERISQACQAIGAAREYFGQFHEAALTLVAKKFGDQDAMLLAAHLFPLDEKNPTHGQRARAKVLELWSGAQRAAKNAPGTAWAAYNAVTELIDHTTRRATAESRFEQSVEGTGAAIKEAAFTYLLAA